MEDKLDRYLNDTAKKLQERPRPQKHENVKKRTGKASWFRMWAASAAMDLFKFYIPLIMLAVGAGIFLIVQESYAKYFMYVFVFVAGVGTTFCVIDLYQFKNWSTKINFKLEGWNQLIHSRSAKYWDMNGEHWVPIKITLVTAENASDKHLRVLEIFLKKLRKDLNRWTVSKDVPMGYSQPKGWTHDGLILSGEMNPRVGNLIRKAFSGELNKLSKLMPGTLDKILITQNGKEEYHQVYTDPAD